MNEYLIVPALRESPWFKPGDADFVSGPAPRIGLYCPHDPLPWLLGSFVLDEEISGKVKSPYWSWTTQYPTGDGLLIRLGGQGQQYLVDDKIRDRDEERAQLRAALASGDPERQATVVKDIDRREATTRSNLLLKCGTCPLRRKFRTEKLHPILSTFWQVGYQEVPLATFAARVVRRA